MLLVCVGLMFVFAYLCFGLKMTQGRKFFVVSVGVVLFLYAAFRGHDLQVDIPGYVNSYEKYAQYSFQEILLLFEKDNFKDPTYYFLGWLFSRLFLDPQWWLAFVAGCYLVVVALLIYKESENLFMSFLLFLALGFFEFSLSGLRQTLAMSFTMLSYFGIKNKKPMLFIVLVLIASLFHQSALIFLLSYPIARCKLGIWHLVAFIFCTIFFIWFQGDVRSLLQKFLVDTQYSDYIDREKTLNFSGFIIQGAIFVFCLPYYKIVHKRYKQANILYNLSFIGVMFQLFSSMIAEMFRVSMYFSFFNIILVTMVIATETNEKIRTLGTVAICFVSIVYMFFNGIPEYSFFWQ